jgi:hypothetical protein
MSMYGEAEMQQFSIGPHACLYEPPDMMVIELRGPLIVDHLTHYLQLRNDLLEGQSHLLTMLLLREMQEVSPEVRSAMSRTRDPRPQATAVIGARYHTRVVAELITRAMRFFTGKIVLLSFFDDPTQGRAWLGQMRERL